jgi:nitroimidazol reductase NimA-like FMN-containing flavoprotein (pyridoxamine 5'-phosphate oxidase superfamily)
MKIREMTKEECFHVLAGARLARLACAKDNQPYVVPVYIAFDRACACFYGFTTPGQKIEWMRANPRVCVEVDEVASYDRWLSVIAFGHYDELAEPSEDDKVRFLAPERPRLAGDTWTARNVDDEKHRCTDERELAWQALKAHPVFWEPGSTVGAGRTHDDLAGSFSSVYYRIWIDHVTGREASRDSLDAVSYAAQVPTAPE